MIADKRLNRHGTRDNGFATDSFALFGEATLKFLERFELSAGARYSMEERASYQRSLAGNSLFAAHYPAGIVLKDHYTDALRPDAIQNGRNLTNRLVVTGGTGTLADMSAFVDTPREVYLELAVKF